MIKLIKLIKITEDKVNSRRLNLKAFCHQHKRTRTGFKTMPEETHRKSESSVSITTSYLVSLK